MKYSRGNKVVAPRHFSSARPVRPTPREPLRPPADGPQGPRGRLVFRTKGECCRTANPAQAGPWPERRRPRAAPGRPWGGICENRGPGAENSQFSVPEEKFGAPESCPHSKALRTAHAAQHSMRDHPFGEHRPTMPRQRRAQSCHDSCGRCRQSGRQRMSSEISLSSKALGGAPPRQFGRRHDLPHDRRYRRPMRPRAVP